ncbi:MAG: hypothetical protein E6H07_18750 [Bacteroidetes bacterium]|nr:MAG: hypothetical protein E6H07_18750 [Bacteroidota bacterium]
MKIYSLFVSAVCSIVFISCGNNSSDDSAAATPATNTPASTTQPVTTQQNPGTSGSTVTPPPSLAPGQLTQSASANGVVLNPAHGQPGHDCTIAVGQPLKNTTGAASPVVTTQPTQVSQTTTAPPPTIVPVSQPLAGQPKLNPPHGQPGHDCTIAVGQPLKSTTTNVSPIVNTQPTQAAQTTTAPTSKPVAGQPRLNPAHGQPGHDCSIGVGMPLKN